MTFSLAHEDGESYHVRHPDGSIIPVPKRSTPKHVLDAIKYLPKMAAGGEVKPEPVPRRVVVTEQTQPVNVQGTPAETKENPAAMRRLLGKVAEPRLARGGPVPLGEDVPTMPTPGGGTGSTFGPEADWLAQSRAVDPEVAANFMQDTGQIASPGAPGGTEGAEALTELPGPSAAVPSGQTTQATGAGMLERPPDQQEQPQGAAPLPFPDLPGYPGAKLQSGIDSMLQQGRAGAEQQAQAQAQQAQEQTKIYSDYQAGLQGIQSRWQQAHADAAGEYANAISDVKSARIDPSRFWSTRTTGQKISATIGMILGGIGSGLTGQPNAALQVIDRAIDRDIEAQKANIGQKNNLVSMLYQKLGSVDAAANAARMYLYGDVSAKVGLAAARAGTLQAQATGKLLESHLQAQALGPMAQLINGSYQAQLQKYQMLWQQRMMQYAMGQTRGGGTPAEPGVTTVTTGNEPMLGGMDLKAISEWRKAHAEQRLDWRDAQGHRYVGVGKPGQTKETQADLDGIDQLRSDINDLRAVADKATTGAIPWSDVRARWDTLQGHFSMLSPRALEGVNRMNDTELKIGKTTTGDSIWRTKLNGGAALDTAEKLLEGRYQALLRGQGVPERYLGAGAAPASVFTAPAR